MRIIVLLSQRQLFTNLIITAMSKVIVNLKRVQVFESENGCNCNLVFNSTIEGFERSINGAGVVSYTKAQVDHISMGRSALTAQLCDVHPLIAAYRGCLDHSFGQKEFGIILLNAELELERELHAEGEVYGTDDNGVDLAYQRECYSTTVIGVKLSDFSTTALEKALTL